MSGSIPNRDVTGYTYHNHNHNHNHNPNNDTYPRSQLQHAPTQNPWMMGLYPDVPAVPPHHYQPYATPYLHHYHHHQPQPQHHHMPFATSTTNTNTTTPQQRYAPAVLPTPQQSYVATATATPTPQQSHVATVAPTPQQQPCVATAAATPKQHYAPAVAPLKELAACSSTTRKQMIYVVMQLKRRFHSTPWGIAFSKFDDAIVLGNAAAVQKNTISSAFVILGKNHHAGLDLNRIYDDASSSSSSTTTTAFHNTFYDNSSILTYAESIAISNSKEQVAPHHYHERLFPGDLIVAIDGKSSRRFLTLSDVTRHFRKSLDITLVVLRLPTITTACMKSMSTITTLSTTITTTPTTDSSDGPYRAAELAFQMWQKTLGARALGGGGGGEISAAATTTTTVNALLSMARQVTVERAAVTVPSHGTHSNHPIPSRQLFTSSTTMNNNNNNKNNNHLRAVSTGGASLDFLAQIATMGHPHTMIPSSTTTLPLDLLSSLVSSSSSSSASTPTRAYSVTKPPPLQRPPQSVARPPTTNPRKPKPPPPRWDVIPDSWRNPIFQSNDKDGAKPIPYDDNWEFSPEEGHLAKLFLTPIPDFQTWLTTRKTTWRKRYKVYKVEAPRHHDDEHDDEFDYEERTVAKEFWKHREDEPKTETFEEWLSFSLSKWKLSYSWNKRKRKRIQQECEEVVHISHASTQETFLHWLHIRRNQWRLLRRKRQRQRNESSTEMAEDPDAPNVASASQSPHETSDDAESQARKRPKLLLSSASKGDMAFFDDILEEEERHRKVLEDRPPIDISFLFDASLGAPDDVVVHCFSFLEQKEHGKLLCINKTTSAALANRENVWRQLCPTHWVLPRRPRKPWHRLYISKLRDEQLAHQKRWDDLMLKCSAVLLKGDLLQKIEKIVQKGEREFGFTVNYVSPVVCERNSILNLAVIHGRPRTVRWLVDQKGADIETYDRGRFTPLLNAAWAGDRQLVRLFLQRGSDRSIVGTGHYSEGLAPADFKGLTAEQWARKKGHNEIAELIRLGL